jgi:hypothetical protein
MPKSTNSNVSEYTKFYSTLVSKKLQRKQFSELKTFISDGKPFPSTSSTITDSGLSFRDILDNENTRDIWKIISPSDSSRIGDIFESLINEQKKINTILPTKNNIESSRGHTCVLVKIKEGNNVQYFPLFDMAGTENTEQINKFLKEGKDTAKMAKLVKIVNQKTIESDIYDQELQLKFPSLNDLLKYDKINSYVSPPTRNKYITIISQDGGKNKVKIDEFSDNLVKDLTNSPGEEFLNKVVKEGYYINHTISMLIFASMCVGYSLRTEINSSGIDQFDNFMKNLFEDIGNFTCIPSSNASNECLKKTMMLLSQKTPESILNSSCIWLQILFSFLYWNKETPRSIQNMLEKLDRPSLDYLLEPEVIDSYYIPNILTIKNLLQIGKISDDESSKLNEIYTRMDNINKNNEYYSPNSVLAENVSTIIVENDKLIIEKKLFNPSAAPPTKVTISGTIDNEMYADWELAEKARAIFRKNNSKIDVNLPFYDGYTQGIQNIKYSQLTITPSPDKDKYNQNPRAQVIEGPIERQRKISLEINWNMDKDNLLEKLLEKVNGLLQNDAVEFTKLLAGAFASNKYKGQMSDIVSEIKSIFGPNKLIETISILSKTEDKMYHKKLSANKLSANKLTFNDLRELAMDIKFIIGKRPGSTGTAKTTPNPLIPKEKILEVVNQTISLPNVFKILKTTGGKLVMTLDPSDPFNLTIGDNNISLKTVMEKLKNLPASLPNPSTSVSPTLITDNQMRRVKDGLTTATKKTLMHLVTGQGVKHYMVQETIGLCNTLWEATNLDLTN